jgi:hypothetical protein
MRPLSPAAENTPSLGPSGESPPLWRRALPFVFAGLLVAFVASRLDVDTFRRAIARTNYVGFIGLGLAFYSTLLVADAFATTYVYRHTIAAVRFRDILVVRAASYLPALLNHHVGQAWLTYFVAKKYGVPVARAAGATLVGYATTFGALYVVLLLGLPFNHGRVHWLAPTAAAIFVAAVGYAIVLLKKPAFLARSAVFAPVLEAGLAGHVQALIVRIPHVLVQFAGAWLPFAFFDMHIPFVDALGKIPIILFVVTLPVSPQGLGTREALSIALLSDYATGTPAERAGTIAAATLSWLFVLVVLQLVLSPLFMRRAYALLGRGVPEV